MQSYLFISNFFLWALSHRVCQTAVTFRINRTLIDIGFSKYDWCNCVYNLGSEVILLLYVDDMVLFGRNRKCIDKAITLLSKHFDVKVLGKTRKMLGVEFEEIESCLVIHQETYINEICDRFKSHRFPISSLPISKGSVYSKSCCPQTDCEITEMSKLPYRNILGCLSFIANRTRPDISYALNIFSQFQSNPGMIHWNGLLRLLGYVANTRDHRLTLSCSKPQIIVYSDADFAANRDDRTSIGGQLILLDNSPIAWRTFKEKSVSLSTMEAEFVAMTEAAKELLWFDRILDECLERKVITGTKTKSLLLVDNQAAIDFVRSPIENYHTKHIDIKLFFIRDLVFKDVFEVKHVISKLNFSDIFTKPQSKYELQKFIDRLFYLKKK